MKEFQGKDYLLHSPFAVSLYEKYAQDMPIFDFHCHLSPKEIYEDHHFSSISEAWLGKDGAGDHYKWRLLRQAGVSEELITGKADDEERFFAFAKALPTFFGNPIYEWTHLELKRFFGIDELLNEKNAEEVYDRCNEILEDLSARKMMEKSNVKAVFTTDDPADDLRYHKALKEEGDFAIEVRPCWRPDRFLHIGNAVIFQKAIKELEERIGNKLPKLDDLLKALSSRLDFFQEMGCKAADHGLDTLRFSKLDQEAAAQVYAKSYRGEPLSEDELDVYESYLLVYLGKEYKRLGFVQQYHIGAIRNNSKKGYALHGPDFGYDAVGDSEIATRIASLLSTLEEQDALPPTVLYCLNPKDYASLLSILNCFQGYGKGYLQLGAAWWFNDHLDGIREQLRVLMAGGILTNFVGMLTDSRSFLSYPRHEYFRRILVDDIARVVEEGRYPNDEEALGNMIRDICYNNAVRYFSLQK